MRRPPAAHLSVLLLVLAVTACGAAPPRTGPTGVDLLEVPTPSPSPADFVETVDNPWFPLEAGSTWEYDVTGVPGVAMREASVVAGEEILGVPVTGRRVVDRGPDGSVVRRETSWFAQDREGNVWLLGREVDTPGEPRAGWRVGRDGAAAGLLVPAEPRVGDGWVVVAAPGYARQLARVVDLEATVRLEHATYDDALELELTTPGDGERVVRRSFVAGTGPVERVVLDTGATYRLVGSEG